MTPVPIDMEYQVTVIAKYPEDIDKIASNFMVFFNNYASGLSYYYFLSLLITIIQTYSFRFIIKEDKVRAKMRENAKKPKKKSGFMARLEEMQRQQQAMLREQQKKGNRR